MNYRARHGQNARGAEGIYVDAKPRIVAPWPAAPGNNATIIMFTTHPKVATGSSVTTPSTLKSMVKPGAFTVSPDEIAEIELLWHRNNQASAANGLRLYVLIRLSDGTTEWVESDCKNDSNNATIGTAAAIQVPSLAAPQEWRETFRVNQYLGFAIEYTAGATGPTQDTGWAGNVILHRQGGAVVH